MISTTNPDRATLWPAILCTVIYFACLCIFPRQSSLYLQGMFFYLLVCLSGVPALFQRRFKKAASYLAAFLFVLCLSFAGAA